MKKVILVLWLMPALVCGQIFYDFESGSIGEWIIASGNHWAVDTILPVAGTYSLHHSYDNPDSGFDLACLEINDLVPSVGETKWSFKVRHGYDPSSSNNWCVFIMSDTGPGGMIPGGSCNGFAAGVNVAGYDDTLRLWKITGGVPEELVSTDLNWQNDIGSSAYAEINVTRTSSGQWEMEVMKDGVREGAGAGHDNELFDVRWFGVYYEYTSTRDRLLWIDDILIDGVFIEDYEPARPSAGDIIISEIMADPYPPVDLPGREYLEIFNKSSTGFSLRDWQLVTESHLALFPDIFLGPGEYLIICSPADTSLFRSYGAVAGVKSFPALNDDGKWIVLRDKTGNMIHSVSYSSTWYGNGLKSGGGWSLEMIDTDFPFYEEGNWKASVSQTGGTPGSKNSVAGMNPDNEFAGIINVFPVDSLSVQVYFSEPVDISSGELEKIMIDNLKVREVILADEVQKGFLLLSPEVFQHGKIFTLTCPPLLVDFAGNKPEAGSFRFGLPEKAVKGDIVINEILFNPVPGGADYVELYNNSEKITDLSRLYLAAVNDETADTSSVYPVSQVPVCFLPGRYVAITTDRKSILERFFSCKEENLFQVSQLPSLPDDGGHLLLLNRQTEVIDNISYSDKMHLTLLSGTEGIALERIRPDINLWHSASELSGWGTPGCQNSVFSENPVSGSLVSLSSTRITPDNDGNEDFLVIDLNFPSNGNIIEVTVFDENGILVRKLAENQLAGLNNSISWDSTYGNGSLVQRGIYIIYISVFDEKGNRETWKKVCTVLR